MKVREAVSRLRNVMKEHYSDSVLSNRFLWDLIKTASYQLIQREGNSIYNSSNFKCDFFDTEEVNLLENSCVPLNCLGCRFKLPETMDNKFGIVYRFLGTPDLSKQFTIVSPANFSAKEKIRGSGNYAFIDGDYVYFKKCYPCFKFCYLHSDLLAEDSTKCSKMDSEISIPNHLLEVVFRMSPESLNVFARKPYDHVTNKSSN
jgi:hypothetical protein